MLKALIKKQFFECFRSYFVNTKTGKKRSGGAIAGMFVLFAALMLMVCAMFGGIAFLLGGAFLDTEYAWLYYAVMGMISIFFGIFGSVFNTFSMLYLAKDNDLLLSMPILPRTILISRMSLVLGLSLLYSGLIWIPTVAVGWILGNVSVMAAVFDVLLFPIISLFVMTLTCALGWVVAYIAKRLKNKSIITVFLSIAFFCLYYFVCFRIGNLAELISQNGDKFAETVKRWVNFSYQLGMAATGNIVSMLLFAVVTAVVLAVCLFVLSRSFISIVTKSDKTNNKVAKVASFKSKSTANALFFRELKRFTFSPLYMLNCGLGIFILPVIAVVVIIKRSSILTILDSFSEQLPMISDFLPLAVVMMVCMVISINLISTPSISLEGKSLWILRSLPISGKDVLRAKLNLHVLLNSVPAIVSMIVIALCLKIGPFSLMLGALLIYAYVQFTGAIGLVFGVKRPNFTWTSESMPIKQSMNILFVMLIGVAGVLIIGGLYYVLHKFMSPETYLAICFAVFLFTDRMLCGWLNTKGAETFDKL